MALDTSTPLNRILEALRDGTRVPTPVNGVLDMLDAVIEMMALLLEVRREERERLRPEREQREKPFGPDRRDGSLLEVLLIPGHDVLGTDLESCGQLNGVLEITDGKNQCLVEIYLFDRHDVNHAQQVGDGGCGGGPVPGLPYDVVNGREGMTRNETQNMAFVNCGEKLSCGGIPRAAFKDDVEQDVDVEEHLHEVCFSRRCFR